MNVLEFNTLRLSIADVEKMGWKLTPIAPDMVKVEFPAKYLQRLGMVPNAYEMFASWWNAVCWCKGFTAAMRHSE